MKVKKLHILQLILSAIPVITGWYYAWIFMNKFYGLVFVPRWWGDWVIAGLNTCTLMQPIYAITSIMSCQAVFFFVGFAAMLVLSPGQDRIDVLSVAVAIKERSIEIYNCLRQNPSKCRIMGIVGVALLALLIITPVMLNGASVICLLRQFLLDRYVILASPIVAGLLSYLVPYVSLEQGCFAIILYASFSGTVLKDAVLVMNCLTMQKEGIDRPASDTISSCEVTNTIIGDIVAWNKQGSQYMHKNTLDDLEDVFELASKFVFIPVIVKLILGLSWEKMCLTYMRDERFKWLFDRPKWHLEELRALDRKHFLYNMIIYGFEVADTASILQILKNFTGYNYEMFIIILVMSTSVHFILSSSGFMYNMFSRRNYSSYSHYQILRKGIFTCQNVVYFSLRTTTLSLVHGDPIAEPLYLFFMIKNVAFAFCHLVHIFLLRKNLRLRSTENI